MDPHEVKKGLPVQYPVAVDEGVEISVRGCEI
jgi:hypothetical protein